MSRFVSILAAAALIVGLAASQASSSDRSTLHGSAPPWANSHNQAGNADPAGSVGFRVYLGWQGRRRSGRTGRLRPAQQLVRALPDAAAVPAELRSVAGGCRRGPVLASQPGLHDRLHAAEQPLRRGRGHSRAGATPRSARRFGCTTSDGKTLRSPDADVSIPNSLGDRRHRRARPGRERRVRAARPLGDPRRRRARASGTHRRCRPSGRSCSRRTRSRPASTT